MNMRQPETHNEMLFVSSGAGMRFCAPEAVITCDDAGEIHNALRQLDDVVAQGYYVAGYMAYEAGWALLERPLLRKTPALPLLWFGVHKTPQSIASKPAKPARLLAPLEWRPQLERKEYDIGIGRIRAYIQSGDTYQVNFTFPLTASFNGDPRQWFWQLYAAQPTDHAAYLDTGRHKIISLSPELFFRLSGEELITRPMKGTLPRGLYPEADEQAREQLRRSEKDRAENVMIVDLLRNDMGRISRINSVQVDSLFDVERYATVWQMTSTIRSRTDASFSEVFTALFPSGSVTGAPKIRSMEIIDEVEAFPRGVYCGAVGWWGPDRTASFNVAIRTITLDTQTQQATYPVGGGITWYSNAEGEYAECVAKARAVTQPSPQFSLLETLLYDGAYFLLEEHLDRLCASAAYFDMPVERQRLRDALLGHGRELSEGRWKIRLLAHRDGAHTMEAAPLVPGTAPERQFRTQATMPPHDIPEVRAAPATTPIDKNNVFLYHKTTHRVVYEEAKKNLPDTDDVLLWNEEGELTESAIANIVAELDGKLVTPPVSCGLLAGVMRGHLLRSGAIQEGVIRKDDLGRINNLYLINSVRGWMRVVLLAKQN